MVIERQQIRNRTGARRMKNHSEQRAWNDNKGFLERLDQRFDEANQAANEGFILAWYRHLRTIYRIMHHKIKSDTETRKENEKDEEGIKILDYIKDKFKTAKNKVNEINGSYGNKFVTQQLQSFSLTDAEVVLDEIDITLSDLYVKYFIRLELDDKDPGEAIREVFNK